MVHIITNKIIAKKMPHQTLNSLLYYVSLKATIMLVSSEMKL